MPLLPLQTKLLALAHASGFPDARTYLQNGETILWSPRGLWSLGIRQDSQQLPGQPSTWSVSFERPFGPPVSATVLTEWDVLTFLQRAISSPSADPGA